MERKRQGSRNRCSGHREQMGLQALVEKTVALTHSKAMLLINHHQSQTIEGNWILQEGMGSHKNAQRSAGEIAQNLSSAASWSGASEQLHADVQWRQPIAQIAVVLRRQHFCWRHQGSLAPSFHSTQQRGNRHNGFSTSHIPLHEPRHRFGAHQILFNFREHPLLSTREFKRKQRQKTADQSLVLHPPMQHRR